MLCLGAVPLLHRLTGAVQVMKEGVPRPKIAEPLFRALAGVDSDVGHLEATSPRSEFTFTLAISCVRERHAGTNLLGCMLACRNSNCSSRKYKWAWHCWHRECGLSS